jgi:hypothetical protein
MLDPEDRLVSEYRLWKRLQRCGYPVTKKWIDAEIAAGRIRGLKVGRAQLFDVEAVKEQLVCRAREASGVDSDRSRQLTFKGVAIEEIAPLGVDPNQKTPPDQDAGGADEEPSC